MHDSKQNPNEGRSPIASLTRPTGLSLPFKPDGKPLELSQVVAEANSQTQSTSNGTVSCVELVGPGGKKANTEASIRASPDGCFVFGKRLFDRIDERIKLKQLGSMWSGPVEHLPSFLKAESIQLTLEEFPGGRILDYVQRVWPRKARGPPWPRWTRCPFHPD